jgi:molecular chaperone DnaK (HSP70)
MSNNGNNKSDKNDNNNDDSDNNTDNNGIWIGIDLGTSNCACAVWDSTRGSPKWMRLADIAPLEGGEANNNNNNGKLGRLVPSLVDHPQHRVGARARPPNIVSSAKRLLGRRKTKSDDKDDKKFLASLPFQVIEPNNDHDDDDDDDDLQIRLPNGQVTTPDEVISILLNAIRLAAQKYLDKFQKKKSLRVPGGGETDTGGGGGKSSSSISSISIRHVVVGVPAHFSKRATTRVREAARNAGFDGTVRTCLESTAAAMAYGLTLQQKPQQQPQNDDDDGEEDANDNTSSTIMVIDMGGGTTDITIATKNNTNHDDDDDDDDDDDPSNNDNSYKVLVTQGDSQLGGDDIDYAIMEYCLSQTSSSNNDDDDDDDDDDDVNNSSILDDELRKSCRKAKEALCDLESPTDSETIHVNNGKSVKLTQQEFERILQPWLQRAKRLIQQAVEALEQTPLSSPQQQQQQQQTTTRIQEVILVGGTTRVPAIRQLIQSHFPTLELCTSIHPMSSVAQGLAIQAAIYSKLVPLHELKSAMMLDCIPHAIGIALPHQGGFVEILPRNTPLPARGSATFVLADPRQAGVSIKAVEQVGKDVYEPMAAEDFTFLLKRLNGDTRNSTSSSGGSTTRSIEVGMMVDTQGQFIVSIFDENDPEQVRKRERFAQTKNNEEAFGQLEYIVDLVRAETEFSTEQYFLTGILIAVFVLYIAVRIAFSEPGRDGATIL